MVPGFFQLLSVFSVSSPFSLILFVIFFLHFPLHTLLVNLIYFISINNQASHNTPPLLLLYASNGGIECKEKISTAYPPFSLHIVKEKGLFMEDEQKTTLFDEQLQSRELQILKTTIPYLKEPQQKNLAILAKCLELQKTIRFFQSDSNNLSICSVDNPEENTINMLNEIRPYCTKTEQENLDSFINMIQLFSAYDLLFR